VVAPSSLASALLALPLVSATGHVKSGRPAKAGLFFVGLSKWRCHWLMNSAGSARVRQLSYRFATV
jgi:hypothetical protein